MFRLIHILSTLDKINFGIWNAALFGTDYLRKAGIDSEAWVTTDTEKLPETFPDIHVEFIGVSPNSKEINQRLSNRQLRTDNTIIVTHGVWLGPSSVGNELHSRGFKWIYAPHGMLEPWSMSQNAFKKKIYFWLFERTYARKATRVRAVSSIEQSNLADMLKRPIILIENGVNMPSTHTKASGIVTFLFLGRLHYKKGIGMLVEAWKKVMSESNKVHLVIAGPDEGELLRIQPYMTENVSYTGPVYGERKAELLRSAHYFVLPSFSEGFPTSVVEAMSYGAIPVISSGCNIPEVFAANLGHQMEPDPNSIESVLRELSSKDFDSSLSERNRLYAEEKFSETPIGDRLRDLYLDTLNSPR